MSQDCQDKGLCAFLGARGAPLPTAFIAEPLAASACRLLLIREPPLARRVWARERGACLFGSNAASTTVKLVISHFAVRRENPSQAALPRRARDQAER